MFKPNENQDRRSYRELLKPPDGYQLEKAVGTTYSLDLSALTAALICLEFCAETDSKLMQNPVSLFCALKKAVGKVLIFCEAGQIRMPSSPSPLFLFLEKIIIPVALPRDGISGRSPTFPSFHPKTWLLAFVNAKGERKYRFVVLSRNLTFDRSWDVSFSMESSDKKRQEQKTKPILDFLEFLWHQANRSRQNADKQMKMISRLIRELKTVSFALDSAEFGEDFQIIPLGIGTKSYDWEKDALFCQDKLSENYAFHDLVILSPFLSSSVIEAFNQKERGLSPCTRILITRKSELSRLRERQADQFELYTLKSEVVDGEDCLSEENTAKRKQDIHAKLYLMRKGDRVDLYLGSMNASFSGFHRNVEMMVRLGTKSNVLNAEKLLSNFFCGSADGENNPFEKVSLSDGEKEKESQNKYILEQKIKNLCRRQMRAAVSQRGNLYCISVEIPGVRLDQSITMSPFRSAKKQALRSHMEFEDIELLQLSEFYHICAKKGETFVSRIILIPTAGIPDERENAVVSSVIKDRASFAEYISIVLGEDRIVSLMEGKRIRESGLFRQANDSIVPALYEKMLRAALEAPEQLKEIREVMKMVEDKTVIPDVFRETYAIFCRALRIRQR